MRKLFLVSLFFITITLSSCSSDSNTNNQSTPLEGVWKLQNASSGAKLTFEGQDWELRSGTVVITGTFTLTDNVMSAIAVSRSGGNSGALQPNTFTGNISISNNKVTFTNFSGNWYAVFSTWYQKQ